MSCGSEYGAQERLTRGFARMLQQTALSTPMLPVRSLLFM